MSRAARSFFRWKLTVGCDRPRSAVKSQTQTGSAETASRLTIRTRAGSDNALNSTADVAASPSESVSTDSGTQHCAAGVRSEEHTSELQSPCNLVCRLLLEKKKMHATAHTISART